VGGEEEEMRVGGDVSKYVLYHFALVECHYPNCTHTRPKTLTAVLLVRYGRQDVCRWLRHWFTASLLAMRVCTLVWLEGLDYQDGAGALFTTLKL